MAFLSEKGKYALNPIEEEDKLAERLERKGKRIIRLNRGDPAKYFPTPKYIIRAYKEALENGITGYTAAEGSRELRGAVSARYSRLYGLRISPDDITVTQGVSEALMFLNSALINESDSAVLFRPYYPLYLPWLKLNGGNAIIENYDENSNWEVHIDGLKRSLKEAAGRGKTDRIKYMMITNPNNPTGTVLSKRILEEVIDLANEHRIFLISDEIYDEIVYNKARFTSISQLAKGIPHAILNGASKAYDSTGFRIGYIIVPEKDKLSQMLKERLYNYALMRLSVNSPAQFAVVEAIKNVKEHKRAIGAMVKSIESRANHATKLLNENPYLQTVEPNGAFYILPRVDLSRLGIKGDKEFTDLLLEKEGIQVTRGSGFGASSHFRIVALPPKEILDYAINRINAFCKAYSK
jgi:aspartate/methionine/tyrosine aminotransferase